ncbi:MAG: hypothetical protein AAGK14_14015 [Verrucomicrobiota bacterium]
MKFPCKRAFSLVEVVLALAIISFVVMVLLGMFSVGLNTNRDSVEELEATHIAQSMLAERRAAPLVENNDFLLPRIDRAASQPTDNPVLLTSEGVRLDPEAIDFNPSEVRYALVYDISPDNAGNSSHVYVCLFWPPEAGADNASGRVEFVTAIAQ